MSKKFPQPAPEVFAAAKRGDREAIAHVVDAYRYLVRREAANCAGPRNDVLDLEQEGIAIMLDRCLPRYDPKRRFSTLLVIALRQHLAVYAAGDSSVIRGPTPYNYRHKLSSPTVEAAKRARCVRSLNGFDCAIARRAPDSRPAARELVVLLPHGRTRTIMWQRHVEGWTYDRIAEEHGVSREHARKVVRTGTAQLKAIVGKRRPRWRDAPPKLLISDTGAERFRQLVRDGTSVRQASLAVGISRSTGSRLCRLLDITRRCRECGLPLVRNQSKWCSQCGPRHQ